MELGVLLDNVIKAYGKRKPIAIISDLHGNRKLLVGSDGELIEETENIPGYKKGVIDKALKLMAGSQACAVMELEVGNKLRKVIIDVVRPPRSLIIFGAGHVGNAVAVVGAFVGFEVTIIDDREAFLKKDRFTDEKIRPLLLDFSSVADAVDLSEASAVVIVTRGHQYDEICLRGVLGHKLKYLGMIGSRRRVISIMEKLVKEGMPEDRLAMVHAPIGLKIGAKSPQEIAVAIVAEIIQSFNT